jgi:hypothetical protein
MMLKISTLLSIGIFTEFGMELVKILYGLNTICKKLRMYILFIRIIESLDKRKRFLKNFEKRVKKYLKLLRGKHWKPVVTCVYI